MMLPLIFLGTTLLSIVLFYYGTGKSKSVLFFFPFWALVIGTLSYIGFFEKADAFPPRILVVMIPAVLYIVWFYRKLERSRLRPNVLLSIHILRVPVELVLYGLYLQGKVPVLMTFEGWNFDVLSGISALILLLYILLAKRAIDRTLLKIWNILGLVLLAIIVSIAILSAPSRAQQLAFENPNLAILEFPYTLLPAVVVPIVLLSHLLCLKMLKSNRRSN